MEPHSERSCGATTSEASLDSTPGEPPVIGGSDLAPCLNETVPSSSDEDTARDPEKLITIDFPPQYAAIKAESRVLAAISTVTDARTRLICEQLKDDLKTMDSGVRDLTETVLSGSSMNTTPTDVYERESGLRYWLVSADGTRRLFSEWIVFFQARPDYLALAPFDVQDIMESLNLASAEVQQRALEVTFNLSPSDVYHGPRQGPPSVKFNYVPIKRARLDSRMEQPPNPSKGYGAWPVGPVSSYHKDGVHGRKKARWSNCRINAWIKIIGVPYYLLPDLESEDYENELESHCTPVAADIRLCNYPVSVEELLTYFPDHTYWREPAQRLRKTWPARTIAKFIFWSRCIRNDKILERTALEHRLMVAKKMELSTHPTTIAGSMENISCTSAVPDMKPYDVFVCDLVEGVRHHPTGQGAQLLTRVVQHALKHENPYVRQLRLSQVVDYAARHDITVPEEDRMGPVAEVDDKAALDRQRDVVTDWYNKYVR